MPVINLVAMLNNVKRDGKELYFSTSNIDRLV